MLVKAILYIDSKRRNIQALSLIELAIRGRPRLICGVEARTGLFLFLAGHTTQLPDGSLGIQSVHSGHGLGGLTLLPLQSSLPPLDLEPIGKEFLLILDAVGDTLLQKIHLLHVLTQILFYILVLNGRHQGVVMVVLHFFGDILFGGFIGQSMSNDGNGNWLADFSKLYHTLHNLYPGRGIFSDQLLFLNVLVVQVQILHFLLKVHDNIFLMKFCLADALGVIGDQLVYYLEQPTFIILVGTVIQSLQLQQTLVIVVTLLQVDDFEEVVLAQKETTIFLQ